MADLFLHPSVTSFITDQSQVFTTAAGATTLYCPMLTSRGKDNVLQIVDGPGDNDFISKFGTPDAIRFGQSHLNVIQWLNAGGTVVAMRCLPEDAEYAHAILDFQTKSVSVKKWVVLNGNFEINRIAKLGVGAGYYFSYVDASDVERVLFTAEQVAFHYAATNGVNNDDDLLDLLNYAQYGAEVFGSTSYGGGLPALVGEVTETRTLIRPRFKKIAGSKATTKAAIEAYAASLNGKINTDGYTHNVIGFFAAEGRGAEYYNNLEFRLTPNDALDDTYSFRIFNLEIFSNEAGARMSIEGPFQVSFDVTALDRSSESMFVGSVLERYGKGTTFTLLDAGFDALGTVLNPEVDPALQDPFFLTERNLSTGLTSIHKMNVLSNGQTQLKQDVYPGDTEAYVNNAAVLFPGGQVILDGTDLITLGTDLNVTSGRISFASAVLPGMVETVTAAWVGGVETLIASLAPVAPATTIDIAKFTLDNIIDATGYPHLKLGAAVLTVNDGVNTSEVPVNVTAFDNVTKTFEIESAIPVGPGYTITFKQVKFDASSLVSSTPEAEYNTSGIAAVVKNNGGVVVKDPVLGTFAIGAPATIKTFKLLPGLADNFVTGEAIMSVDAGTVTVQIASIDVEENTVTLAEGIAMTTTTTLPNGLKQIFGTKNDGSLDLDFSNVVGFSGGSAGSLFTETGTIDADVAKSLLVAAYTGSLNEDILLKKFWPIDVILDANYTKAVKDACHDLASVIRQDCIFVADLGFTANPQQALDMRSTLGYSTFYASMFSQDAIVYDSYTGRQVKVTMPYFVAGKIPLVDRNSGLHWTFVGPRRGVITGFTNLSWNPTDNWQERLYRKQVNYVKRDPRRTMLYGQLTSQTVNSALSDINHVRAILRMQREVENMMEDYNFEFINEQTLSTMNYNLNAYLQGWVSNGACEKISGSVYASDYDKKSKVARVRIEMVFTAVLERIIINFVVK